MGVVARPSWRVWWCFGGVMTAGVMAGALLVIRQVRIEAGETLSQNNCEQIAIGVQHFAAGNDDHLPGSLDTLIPHMIEGSDPQMINEILASPMRPASEPADADAADYVLRTDLAGLRMVDIGFPSSTILALDSDMLASGHPRIAVALADGSAARLTRAELRELCEAEHLEQNHALLEIFEIDRWVPADRP